MKRTPCKQPSTSGKRAVTLDPIRLSAARGGLDIAVRVAGPPAFEMRLQHNELLITQQQGRIETMKRTQPKQPFASGKRAVALDPTRLDAAHGGLDVAVSTTSC
jgi:hypothetical protein